MFFSSLLHSLFPFDIACLSNILSFFTFNVRISNYRNDLPSRQYSLHKNLFLVCDYLFLSKIGIKVQMIVSLLYAHVI